MKDVSDTATVQADFDWLAPFSAEQRQYSQHPTHALVPDAVSVRGW